MTPQTSDLDLQGLARRAFQLFSDQWLVHVAASALVLVGSILTATVLLGPLLVGYVHLVRRALRQEPLDVTQLSHGFERFGASFTTWAVYLVGVTLGCLAFVLPGVVLAIAWAPAFWFVAYGEQSVAASLSRAWALATRAPSALLLLALLIVGLNFIGVMFVLGGLLTLPLTVIGFTLAMEELCPELVLPRPEGA